MLFERRLVAPFFLSYFCCIISVFETDPETGTESAAGLQRSEVQVEIAETRAIRNGGAGDHVTETETGTGTAMGPVSDGARGNDSTTNVIVARIRVAGEGQRKLFCFNR